MRPLNITLFLTYLVVLPIKAQEIRISEIMMDPSDRQLTWDPVTSQPRLGSGYAIWDAGYQDGFWSSGALPIGFGVAGLSTNVASAMQGKTPNLYLRKTFTATAAQVSSGLLVQLQTACDDGFICWINGKEVSRANMGPSKHYVFADQPAYNPESRTGLQNYSVGTASSLLVEGSNTIVVQAANSRALPTSSNNSWGAETPTFSADIGLRLVAPGNTVTAMNNTFPSNTGAYRQHTNNNGTVGNTTSGTFVSGGWLANSQGTTSAATGNLTARVTESSSGGISNGGALLFSFTQSGAVSTYNHLGPVLNFAGGWTAGGVNAAALANTTIRFRYRSTAGAQLGIRLQPTAANTTDILDGFPILNADTSTAEAAPVSFSNANNGYNQIANSGGTGVGTTVGSPPVPVWPWSDPASTGYTIRTHQDATANAGAASSTGHLRFEVTNTGSPTPSYVGFTLPGFYANQWTPGAITTSNVGLVSIRIAHNAPSGQVWRVDAVPPGKGYNERVELGNLTGTGSWATSILNFSGGANLAAFISSMNSLSTRNFVLSFSGPNTMTVGNHLRIDDVKVLPWVPYEVSLGAGNQPGNRFINALNAANLTSMVPVFYKTADWAAGATVTIDNIEFVFNGADPSQTQVLLSNGAAGGSWKYHVGRYDPAGGVVDPGLITSTFTPPAGEEADYDEPASFVDWVELENPASTPANISGWYLSDDPINKPNKWAFPANTIIPAGGHLLVLCDGRDEANAPVGPAQRLHANFSLNSGEFVTLFDPDLNNISEFSAFAPPAVFNASYGLVPGDPANTAYLTTATPGAANAGQTLAARVEAPEYFAADGITPRKGGRFTGNQTLVLKTTTPSATIRYTLDGSEPTATTGTIYSAPLTLTPPNNTTAVVVRSRAFLTGWMPSATKTESYLINQDPAISNIPAMLFTGNAGRTFYKPEGLMAIQGPSAFAAGTSDIWVPTSPDAYNIPVGNGQPYERETHLEWYFNPGYYPNPAQESLSLDFGLRLSSSPYSRPRLTMSSTNTSPFNVYNPNEKCSWNLFFRADFGPGELDYPIFPNYTVRNFQNLRLRAGKNDIDKPFVTDELVRRTFDQMGHVSPRGLVCSLYMNGIYKGLYNLCERIREPMFQRHFRSENIWEVRYVGEWVDGLPAEVATQNVSSWNSMNTIVNNTTATNYWTAVNSVLDVDNVADYFLLNIYNATWDWPWNNYAIYRERSAGPNGRFRFTVWDAEGAMFVKSYYVDYITNGTKNHQYNTITQDLTGRDTYDLPRIFARLRTNAEFRLRFADRVNRALFNKGALDDRDPDGAGPQKSFLKGALDSLVAEANPSITKNTGSGINTTPFDTWFNATSGRRSVILPKGVKNVAGYTPGHLRAPTGTYVANNTFWPETEPPVFSPHGGSGLPLGSQVTMSGSVGGVAGGVTIYYTTDGSDPRLVGGNVSSSAQVYSSAVTLNAIQTIKARARNTTTLEWSPLTEAEFLVATVPATASNIVVAELMYHPADATAAEAAALYNNADDFEFLRLKNISALPVSLENVAFNIGIFWSANDGTVRALNPGDSCLVVRNKNAFTLRYGATAAAKIAGEFTGGLANDGEELNLVGPDGPDADSLPDVIKNFIFDDNAPWPTSPDGAGPSLILLNPTSNPNHSLAANWTSTAWPGGLVGPAEQNISWTYQQWRELTWGPVSAADPAISGPSADPDGDGMTNLLEYALAGNPKKNDSSKKMPVAGVETISGDKYLTLDFRAPANLPAGLLKAVSSPTLSNWQQNLILVSSVPQPDGSVEYRYRTAQSIPSQQRQFVRLEASQP